jgi:hypothetical protein
MFDLRERKPLDILPYGIDTIYIYLFLKLVASDSELLEYSI